MSAPIVKVGQLIMHPDGAGVIVPVDPEIPSFFVSAEDLKGQDVQPGSWWPYPDELWPEPVIE